MATEGQMFRVMAGFAALVGLFFAGSGLWMLSNGLKSYRASGRRDAFEPVEARVLESELRVSSGEKTSYIPEIEYEYTVAGTTYTSDSVYPGPDFDIQNRNTAESLVDTYSESEIVEAYYDPENPTDAFLENESVATGSLVIMLISGVMTVVGVGLVVGGAFWIL